MDNYKFTKGKWYLQESTDAYTNIIRIKSNTHDTLYVGSTPQDPKSESRYNALLMSKAPELLDMLNKVAPMLERYGELEQHKELIQLIKEATEIK